MNTTQTTGASDLPFDIKDGIETVEMALDAVDAALDQIEDVNSRPILHLKPRDPTALYLGSALAVASAATLLWYFTRSKEERDAANQAVIDAVTKPVERAYGNVVHLFH